MSLNARKSTTALACALFATMGACTTPMGAASAQSASSAPPADIVTTRLGAVRGGPGAVDGVRVFKGIPFAAPPVGALRWEMPRPAAAWEGVRDGTQWGDSCIQNPAPTRFPVNSATDMPDSPGISEDCLYLNVWTPATRAGEKLPVMVWLYGGAYTEGGGSAPFSQGDHLAAKGVVMVTFNYRVGAFGFFAHPELTAASEHGASGNQALGDSIAALQWVKDNIAAFGGNPDNVTIFGESAGAAMNGGPGRRPARGRPVPARHQPERRMDGPGHRAHGAARTDRAAGGGSGRWQRPPSWVPNRSPNCARSLPRRCRWACAAKA